MNTNQTNWQTENKFYHASYRILSCQDSWSTKQINHTHTVLPCTTALTSLLAAWLAVLAGWLIGWLACCLAGWLPKLVGLRAGGLAGTCFEVVLFRCGVCRQLMFFLASISNVQTGQSEACIINGKILASNWSAWI